jgi:hypothetical protein
MTLNWDYIHSIVDISMPGYVAKALERFQHTPTSRTEKPPHAWSKPVYGTHLQLTSPVDDTARLLPSALTRIQKITGTLLFYTPAIDCTMLVTLGGISSNQAKGTHARHRSSPYATPQLCIRPPRRHCLVHRQRHVPPHPQRRLVPLRSQSLKPHWGHLLPRLKTYRPYSNTHPDRHTSTIQRRHPDH